MSTLDPARLAELIACHGRVVRVVVAETHGSTPREAGACLLVWPGGRDGTIGGGSLELQAEAAARAMLDGGPAARLDRLALGPALGQCCGGAVTLLTERWDAAALATLDGPLHARPLPGSDATAPPLAVRRALARARDRHLIPAPAILDGWFLEPLSQPREHLWVWGAGHVGRAIVATLSPLPGLSLTWLDSATDRFPALPPGVWSLAAPDPATLVPRAPRDAHHLVLTYSHALDFALCHRLLQHGFASLGLIGSATKRARFASRLAGLGHAPSAIDRIACPIGEPAFGKHPQAIAIGVAAALLRNRESRAGAADDGAGHSAVARGGAAR